MNKYIQKHCLIFLTLISVPVLFLESKTEDTNSDLVGKKTKEAKKKKGAGFPRVGDEEIRMLRRLMDLSPERLKILRRTIERIENYSEEEREALKKKLSHFSNRSPEERGRKIEDLMRTHARLKEHMEKLSPGERASRMKKFQSLNLNEKKRFLDELKKTIEDRKKS